MSRVVCLGEILLRLATPGHQRFRQAMPGLLQATFAGAEASIAASLAYLGADAAFVTALPEHAIAAACLADLRQIGVDTRQIVRTPSGRLGVYFLEQGVNQRGGEVIYDREGSAMAITSASAYDWAAIFQGCEWFVLSGITPAISRSAAEVSRVAIQEAQARGAKIVFDFNYRSKLWRWEPSLAPRELAMRTIGELLPSVDVFVGGSADVASLLGRHAPAAERELLAILAQELVAKFPGISSVAMTLRDGSTAAVQRFGGALYQAAARKVFLAPATAQGYEPYTISQVVDRLGAGDAFTAGLLYAFLQAELHDPAQAIAFATAAGCLAHSIEGDFHYSTRAEIEALMGGESGGRVNR